MNLQYCTFTGVDIYTDVDRLLRLSKKYPFVEWGILYSDSRAATENKYGLLSWVENTVNLLRMNGAKVAVHLCGSAVKQFVFKRTNLIQLATIADRVQLNLPVDANLTTFDLVRVAHYLKKITKVQLVLQANDANMRHCQKLSRITNEKPYAFLFDSSGGRGISPGKWPSLGGDDEHELSRNNALLGFAGGLGVDNISTELKAILDRAHGKPFWIDMESKVRTTDDRFDLDAVEAVLEKVVAVLEERKASDPGNATEPQLSAMVQSLDAACAKLEGEVAELRGTVSSLTKTNYFLTGMLMGRSSGVLTDLRSMQESDPSEVSEDHSNNVLKKQESVDIDAIIGRAWKETQDEIAQNIGKSTETDQSPDAEWKRFAEHVVIATKKAYSILNQNVAVANLANWIESLYYMPMDAPYWRNGVFHSDCLNASNFLSEVLTSSLSEEKPVGTEQDEVKGGTLEENVRFLLDRCPYTVRQRPGGGVEDLVGTLVVTFLGMQKRLEGDQMFQPKAKS